MKAKDVSAEAILNPSFLTLCEWDGGTTTEVHFPWLSRRCMFGICRYFMAKAPLVDLT